MVFQHNGVYWITSMATGWVLDLSNWQTQNGTKIATWVLNHQDNQVWIASKESVGFRLSSKYQESDSQTLAVLDQQPNSRDVVIWSFKAALGQEWVAVEVPDYDGAVFIKNVQSGLYLRSAGHGEKVECTPLNSEDKMFWWRLVHM